MKKYLVYAMEGKEMCFLHALMNAKQLRAAGHEVKVVLEGAACSLPKLLVEKENPLFRELLESGTIAGVCEACSKALNSYEDNKEIGLQFLTDMYGHAGVKLYVDEEFEVLVF